MILFFMMIIFADINRKNEEGKCNAIVTDRKMVQQRMKALEKKNDYNDIIRAECEETHDSGRLVFTKVYHEVHSLYELRQSHLLT